jgi:hypothetical protein
MTICMLCRRSLLVGEHYRFWRAPRREGEMPVCSLCEDDAADAAWVRLERGVERATLSPGFHVRRIAA